MLILLPVVPLSLTLRSAASPRLWPPTAARWETSSPSASTPSTPSWTLGSSSSSARLSSSASGSGCATCGPGLPRMPLGYPCPHRHRCRPWPRGGGFPQLPRERRGTGCPCPPGVRGGQQQCPRRVAAPWEHRLRLQRPLPLPPAPCADSSAGLGSLATLLPSGQGSGGHSCWVQMSDLSPPFLAGHSAAISARVGRHSLQALGVGEGRAKGSEGSRRRFTLEHKLALSKYPAPGRPAQALGPLPFHCLNI